MNKQETIAAIQAADISEWGWLEEILGCVVDKYARGYIQRKSEELGNSISSDTEEFREEILEAANYDIWGK